MRLIDADRLVYALKNMSHRDGQSRAIKRAIKCVLEEPTIDAEPVRHGKWVKPSAFSETVCSVCVQANKNMFGEKSAYCPNCGAKMDEEE